MGVPLTPFGERTREAIGKLNKTEIDRLQKLGLVIPMEYSSDGKTWQTDYEPVWTQLGSAFQAEPDRRGRAQLQAERRRYGGGDVPVAAQRV
jgi:hypothetical protein